MPWRIAIVKGLASDCFGDGLLPEIHDRKGHAKTALALLAGDLRKRDFAGMLADRTGSKAQKRGTACSSYQIGAVLMREIISS